MAAAAALGPGGRAAGSSVPPLRRGRGRRRRDEAVPADDDGAPETPARRSGQREAPAGEPGPARDFIFRTPITLAKHGELHEEHKSHLRKLRHDKWQEEKMPEDLIHKLMAGDDAEVDRRRTDDQKKEESLIARVSHERFPECLSDSENEEPFQCRPVYRSAFVSKGSAYSVALLAGNFSSKVERSQSCNDTLGNRSKSRQKSAAVRTKANPSAGSSVSLVGVLSSTQNNRCLSAPDLTAEKRLAPASFPILPRQERSISPESNDSISEELNHFKPIVCSPCTPPKQLPDGHVLSPLIIKSTPRNLTRSLQKPTTYEASPRILKKWEQILQERQVKKMLSKATLTTSVPELGEDFQAPNLNIPIKCPLQMSSEVFLLDPLLPRSLAKLDSSANGQRALEATELIPRVLPPRPTEKAPNSRVSELPKAKSAPRPTGACLRFDAKTIPRKVVRVNAALENGTLGNPAERKPRRYWDESGLCRLSNGLRLERGLGEETPSLRRGQKRPCKTKHLDPSVKRLRPSAGCRKGPPASGPLRRQRRRQRGGTEQRLQQEEADRRLAVQLQRQFEREIRIAERPKGRADQYFLRSKNTAGTK